MKRLITVLSLLITIAGFSQNGLNCEVLRELSCGVDDDFGTFNENTNVENYCNGSNTGFSGGEVVYRFQPDETQEYTFRLTGISPGRDLDMFLLEGCDPDACIDNSDAATANSPDVITQRLISGAVYYLVVDTDVISGSGESNYTLSLTCGDEIQELDCTVFRELECDSPDDFGTFNENRNIDAYCSGTQVGFGGGEVVYRFRPTQTQDYTFNLSGVSAGRDLDMFLLESCDPDACIADSDGPTAAAPDIMSERLISGRTYYLVVDTDLSSGSGESNYTLEVGCGNDDCQSEFSFEELTCGRIQFNNNSTGSGLTFRWRFTAPGFSETSTLENPIITFPQDGSYNVSLLVASSLGCESASELILNIEIDKTPPNITCSEDLILQSPDGGDCSLEHLLSLLSIDDSDASIQCFLDGVLISNPGSVVRLKKGENTISYIATDTCGNSSECSYIITVLCTDELFCDCCPEGPQHTFEDSQIGSLPAPNSVQAGWQGEYGNASYVMDGCESSQSIALQGASFGFPGSGVEFSTSGVFGQDILFKEGKQYCISYCYKLTESNFPGDVGDILMRATNTAQSTSSCTGSCNVMDSSPSINSTDGWTTHQFLWTAPVDYFALIISANHTSALDAPGDMLIDNICISEYEQSCKADFVINELECGHIEVINQSCGDDLSFNWDVNGTNYTSQDLNLSGPGTFTITLTITGADGCMDTITKTITTTGPTLLPIVCPKDTTIFGISITDVCEVNYVVPTNTQSGVTITYTHNGNAVSAGSTIVLNNGVHSFVCTAIDICENISECSWTVTVRCGPPGDGLCKEDFEDVPVTGFMNQVGNWTTLDGTVGIMNDASTNGTQVLVGRDGSGSSWMGNLTDYSGDWINDYDGYCFCFDIRYDNGNSNNASTGVSAIHLFENGPAGNVQPGAAVNNAKFVVNNPIGNTWRRVCVPVELSSGGVLPSNGEGSWFAPTASQFDNLIQSVSGISFGLDFAGGSNPSERLYVDNLCFEECPTEPIVCCCPDGPQHTFEDAQIGSLPAPNTVQAGWQEEYGNASYVMDGCESSQSIALQGASFGFPGSGVEFSTSGVFGQDILFEEGKQYCISYCYKLTESNFPGDVGDILMRASNTAQSTFSCTGSCNVMDISPSINGTDGWVTHQFLWTAPMDYFALIISANHTSALDAPGDMLIDNICISEYEQSCKADFVINELECGHIEVINQSCGEDLSFDWDVNGTSYTSMDLNLSGPGTFTITLTITGADGCTDTITKTITTTGPTLLPIVCPKDTTIFGTSITDVCEVNYVVPTNTQSGVTVTYTHNGNAVSAGSTIVLNNGVHSFVCTAIDICENISECSWTVTVRCLIEPPIDSLCGQTAITCHSDLDFGNSDPNGFVLGIVNNKNWASAIPGTNWAAASASIYHHPSWTSSRMGEIFGLTIDAQNNMYVTATSMFGVGLDGPAGPGGIYKIDPSGNVTDFVTTGPFILNSKVLPNDGAGLGNICYDPINNQLFVTNFSDGYIYRLDMTGSVLSRFEPFPGGTFTSGPRFTALGHRPWAIAFHEGQNRLYFSNWNSYPNTSNPTTIHSVELLGGDFVPATLQLDITLSRFNFSAPISDIAISQEGRMLLSGKSMVRDYPRLNERLANWAHRANVYEYEFNSVWSLTPGHGPNPKFTVAGLGRNDAAGGVDYGYESVLESQTPRLCGESIWASGDYLHAGLGSGILYGMMGFAPTGGYNANSVIIDYDNINTTYAKAAYGDVEVFKCGCYEPEVSCDSLMVMANRITIACIDSSQIDPSIICTADFTPVCGCDGNTYTNACEAYKAGVTLYSPGSCNGSNIPNVDELCCYSYDIKNNWGPDIVKLDVEVLNKDWQFTNVNLASPLAFGLTINNDIFDVVNSSGPSIPGGVTTDAITLCFAPAVLNPTGLQEVEFSWYRQIGEEQTAIECRDTLLFDCATPPPYDCFSIVEDTLKCIDPMDPSLYEYCFKVVNNSGFDISQVTLEDLLPGFTFGGFNTKIYNFPSPLPNNATSTEICCNITSSLPVMKSDTFCLKMGLVNVDGDECCHKNDLICTEIEPCCDPCDANGLVFNTIPTDSTECCYSIDVLNECYENYFTKLEAVVITPGVCFGSHLFDSLQAPFWNITSMPQKICMEPTAGFIDQSRYDNLLSFCLDKLDDPTKDNPIVVFNWYHIDPITQEPVIACSDTLITDCKAPKLNTCLEVTEQDLVCIPDSSKYRYTFKIKNVSNLPFTAAKLHLQVKNAPNDYKPFPLGPIITLNPVLPPDSSRIISTCIKGVTGAPFPATLTDFQFSYRLEGVNNGDCCWESVCDTIPIPPCTMEELCCSGTEDEFCDLVDIGWDITIDGCNVTVKTPQFDSCHWMYNDGPDWGDGSVLLPVVTPANGTWTHTYNPVGGSETFIICATIFESSDGGIEECWSKIMCDTIMVDCCMPIDPCIEVTDILTKDIICAVDDCYVNPLCQPWLRTILNNATANGCQPVIDYYTFRKAYWNGQPVFVGDVAGAPDGGGSDIYDCDGKLIQSCRAAIGIQCSVNAGIDISADLTLVSSFWNCGDVLPSLSSCTPIQDATCVEYCFTITNTSALPISQIDLSEVTNTGISISPSVVNLNPVLQPNQSTTETVIICGVLDSGEVVKFDIDSKDLEMSICCKKPEPICFEIPACPPLSDPCDLVSMSLDDASIGEDSCCYVLSIENQYSNTYFKGIKIEVDTPATISQIQTKPGWVINQLNPSEAEIFPISGFIPTGPSDVMEICTANDGLLYKMRISWLTVDSTGECIKVCEEEFEKRCTRPSGCVAIVQDSIDCTTNMYCFKVVNQTFPEIIVKSVEFVWLSPSGATLTPNPYSISPLSSGDTSEWICVTYDPIYDPTCFYLVGHEADLPAGEEVTWCCVDRVKYCIDEDKCPPPCMDDDPCKYLSSSLIDDPDNIDQCCFIASIDNQYCDVSVKGVKLVVKSPASIAQVQVSSNWVINQLNPQEAELLHTTGNVPLGAQEIFKFCNQNDGVPFEIELSFLVADSTGNCSSICTEKYERSCTGKGGCIEIVQDSLDCNNQMYCFKVRNNTSPEIWIKSVEFIQYSPTGVALSPNPYSIQPLASGDTSEWICVKYNAPAGTDLCFLLIGHQADLPAGDAPSWCCADTARFCIEIPRECPDDGDPCDSVSVNVSNVDVDQDNCCHEVIVTNNYNNQFFKGIELTVNSPAILSNIMPASGWTIQSYALQTVTLLPQTGFAPLGTYSVATICTDNYNVNPHELKVSWLADDNGVCKEVCAQELELACEVDGGFDQCIQLVEESIDCSTNMYCFKVQNLNSSIDVNYIELINVLPNSAILSNTEITIPSLGYLEVSDWICVSYMDVSSGDSICYNLTSHYRDNNDNLLICCVDTIKQNVIIPSCDLASDCCDITEEDLLDSLGLYLNTTIDGCEVCIPNLLDSCEMLTVDYADGTVEEYMIGDTICHLYTTNDIWTIDLLLERYSIADTVCVSAEESTMIETSCASFCGDNLSVNNGMSPDNGDNINQTLVINGLTPDCGNVSIKVYNRWGQEVFSQDNYDNSWNGVSSLNRPLPSGTYFVTVSFLDLQEVPTLKTFLDIRRE